MKKSKIKKTEWHQHNMREFIGLVIFPEFIGLLLARSCRTLEIPGNRSAKPFAIDGRTADRENKTIVFFEKPNAVIGRCNDDKNPYLLF
ncbi:MAG: hypothetical protein JSV44_11200 [Candidatus Zixiibacteriota bacterium]|nr:MAG: hypothetical protein JSV44_11200 [candidate division Zixibacteria bacterium]